MGDSAKSKMKEWGMDIAGIQTSGRFPTGTVQVNVINGSPTFDIRNNQAYDDIRPLGPSIKHSDWALLYLGSLAFRNDCSRTSIRQLIQSTTVPRFVDINIRQPWFDIDWLDELLDGAQWVKLNQDELGFVTGSTCQTTEEIRAAVSGLQQEYGNAGFLVTCGNAGTFAIDQSGDSLFVKAPAPQPLVDSVGAGDAFSAAMIYGLLHEYVFEQILNAAVHFASQTCSFVGALTTDRRHYLGYTQNLLSASEAAN